MTSVAGDIRLRALAAGVALAAITMPPPPKKDEKKEEKAKEAAAAAADRSAFAIASYEKAQFGDMPLVQSQSKSGRTWVDMDTLGESHIGNEIWIRARIHSVRAKGKVAFLVLRRGFSTVQAVMFAGTDKDAVPVEMVKYAGKITNESIVDIKAVVQKPQEAVKSASIRAVELRLTGLYVINLASNLPFQIEDAMRAEPTAESKEKLPTVEQFTRLNNRWLDLRTPANHAIFRIQSYVGTFYRQFFLDKDFVEIHSPKITPGVSEGGAAVFRFSYFGNKACLAQSPQLYKQMGVLSDLFKVFEIGPVFRAENSLTHRHLCEFTGLDFEMEIKEHYHEILDVLGDLFVFIFDQLNAKCKKELEAVNEQWKFSPLVYPRKTLTIAFKDAVAMLREAGVTIGDYDDFSTPQEKLLGKLVKAQYNTDFYIVDRYPVAARPFYTMPCPDDPKYTNSYDVFLRGEEITSGAQRIHDVDLLVKRAAECDIPLSNIKHYVESFKYGAYPHGGAGIGLERVVMLFMGLPDIRMSSMFPRDPKRNEP